nr:NADH-quinone oxidoreductase subunit A [Ardenticatena sp.]
MREYAVLGAFLLVGIVLPAAVVIGGWLLGPKRANPVKNSTYECGLETVGETWIQFKVQYYVYALIFVIFDIEVVYLYPWAVAYNRLGLFALVEALIFAGILVAGLFYAWRKGALAWF